MSSIAGPAHERVLLTAEQILAGGEEKLSAEEKAQRERLRQTARGIARFDLSEDGSKILVPLSGRLFVVDRASGKSSEVKSASKALSARSVASRPMARSWPACVTARSL